jgi:hypothetical protein
MSSFADGIGDAMGGMIAFGCGAIVLLALAVVVLGGLWAFDVRPEWWMLHVAGGAAGCGFVIWLVSLAIGASR